MAGSVSKWTLKGSNTNASAVTGDIAGDNPGDSLTDTIVRHECHMWMQGTDPLVTSHFNWPVKSRFTIVFNATDVDLDNTVGTCTAIVEGSVDGSNWITLRPLGTTAFDDAIVVYVYDMVKYGRLPYMRLSVDPNADVDNRDNPIKIVVVEHHIA
jgi:hypothetical protein